MKSLWNFKPLQMRHILFTQLFLKDFRYKCVSMRVKNIRQIAFLAIFVRLWPFLAIFWPQIPYISKILTWNPQNRSKICVTEVFKQINYNKIQKMLQTMDFIWYFLKITCKTPRKKNSWASNFKFNGLKIQTTSKYIYRNF